MIGRILEIKGKKFNVYDGSTTYELFSKGILKYKGDLLKVGDIVEFDDGIINKIEKRINNFIRPNISNVDYVILTQSLKKPDLSLELLDKFLVFLTREDVTPIIVFTKYDLLSEDERKEFNKIYEYYQKYYLVFISNKDGVIEKDRFIETLKNKVSVISGQTGSGKSHLLNNIDPSLNLKTQEISESLNRGKHTTRSVTIYLINNMMIADSPGFSSLELSDIDDVDLKEYYPEFVENLNKCKYNQCTHIHEPVCKIRELVEESVILKSRYDSYVKLYLEIKERRK